MSFASGAGGNVRLSLTPILSGHAHRDETAWLAFLNTVRTERFDQVLALKALLPAIGKAA
jgi:hypothetical protein